MSPATRLLAGGFLTLALAMGVGRFYYTPLLPLMQREFGLDTATAGLIAGANFGGYLVGSIAASFLPPGRIRLIAFRIALVLSIATTAGMGLVENVPAWLWLRFLSGVASAFALILAAGFVSDALSRVGEDRRLGWLFGGVGFGIAASTLLVRLAGDRLGASYLWMVAALGCLAIAPVIWREVGVRRLPEPPTIDTSPRRKPRPMPFWPLFASYVCEGLGYSVFATFIVAILKSRPGLDALSDWVWVVTGLAGLPSCLLWAWAAERIGFANALAWAFLAQIIGVLLPALHPAGGPALLAAILFGGTFMAISVLTLPLGRDGFKGRGFAVLTAGFGLGQMLGPLLAGQFVSGPEDYNAALFASAGVLAMGTACLIGGIVARNRAPATVS